MTRGTNLMQKIRFIILNNSTYFGFLYAHVHCVSIFGLFGASEFDVWVTVHHI